MGYLSTLRASSFFWQFTFARRGRISQAVQQNHLKSQHFTCMMHKEKLLKLASNALKCHYVDPPFKWGPTSSEFLEQVNNSTIDVTYCENEKREVWHNS